MNLHCFIRFPKYSKQFLITTLMKFFWFTCEVLLNLFIQIKWTDEDNKMIISKVNKTKYQTFVSNDLVSNETPIVLLDTALWLFERIEVASSVTITDGSATRSRSPLSIMKGPKAKSTSWKIKINRWNVNIIITNHWFGLHHFEAFQPFHWILIL